MPKIARTVHYSDPDTGELITLAPGDEISEDQAAEINNPAVFEDPDVSPVDNDLASLSDEDFFFAADSNGTVDPETFDEQRDQRLSAAEAGTGGLEFNVDNLETMNVRDLRAEYKRRQQVGVEVPEADMRDKDSLVSALRSSPSEPEPGE